MITNQDHHDQLGVYRIGDLKFYNKLEAIEMQTKTGNLHQWIPGKIGLFETGK